MDLRTAKQKERDARDLKIKRDFEAELRLNTGASTCRIATVMAESGRYGYSSMSSILASLRRTGTIDRNDYIEA